MERGGDERAGAADVRDLAEIVDLADAAACKEWHGRYRWMDPLSISRLVRRRVPTLRIQDDDRRCAGVGGETRDPLGGI